MAGVAAVTDGDSAPLQLLVDWERAPGVTSPELAATWCRLEIVVRGRPVTLVEDTRGGGIRRAVHTSAYPLAEWIATCWWTLREHARPSAVSSRGWTWANVQQLPWQRSHNVRGAGGGMPWPDLTLVPEGAVTHVVWTAVSGLPAQPVSFLTSGDTYLPAAAVRQALGRLVEQVLERLTEAGVTGTVLQREWEELGELDQDERQFAAAAARLGLDPFDVDDQVADQIESLADAYDPELLGEFLDSADVQHLSAAGQWLERARGYARLAHRTRAALPLDPRADEAPPWTLGYQLARAYRSQLGLRPTDRVDLMDLVGLARVAGDPAGLQGLVQMAADGVGLVLPEESMSVTTTRFAQARALGISLFTTRTTALLDPTRNDLATRSRAFAAELLAPAEGIAEYLDALPAVTDRAIDAVADRFDASSALVQRQHENQLA